MPPLEDRDARPLVIPSAALSLESYVSSQRRLDLKFPNLSTLKNLREVELRNCLVKDGLDRLGIQHMENVNEVIIVNCSAELIELAFQIKNLRELMIVGGSLKTLRLSPLSDRLVMKIHRLKDLVEITYFGSHVRMSELDIINCTSLERLNLSKLENISRIKLDNCPKLRTIEGVEGLSLHSLEIHRCGSSLPDLSKLKNLTSLILYDCKEVVEITGLGNLVSLCKLDIIDCISLEWLENFSKLENLSRITLWNCPSLERLENFSKLEKLSEIILHDCPKLRTIEGIEGLFLSMLTIERCRSLQNRDELKKRCKKDARIYMMD